MHIASLAIRFGLAIVFLVAGMSKVRFTEQFALMVKNYELLPDRWSRPVARWLPMAELAIGSLLLFGVLQVQLAIVAAVMTSVFAGAAAINLARGRDIDCGCFGVVGRRSVTWWTVGEDVLLTLGALVFAANPSTTLVVWSASPVRDPSSVDGIAILMSTSLVLLIMFLAAESRRTLRASRKFGERLRSGR